MKFFLSTACRFLIVATSSVAWMTAAEKEGSCFVKPDKDKFNYGGCDDLNNNNKCTGEVLCLWNEQTQVCAHVCENSENKKTCKKQTFKGKKICKYAPTTDPVSTPTNAPTNAPTNNTTHNSTNGTRYLVWDGENMMVEEVGFDSSDNNHHTNRKEVTANVKVKVNESPFAYETDRNICHEVDARLINNQANRDLCHTYLNLPLVKQVKENGQESCDEAIATHKIPKVYYTVSNNKEVSTTQQAINVNNPDWEHRHFGDEQASDFIQKYCGEEVAEAYHCLAPPAYRADLFRFCALYTQGGLYLDSDIMPLVTLEELYDPCSVATVGHDWPQGRPQKQMKILAGQQGSLLFLCMMNKIVHNVRNRVYPDNPLALTGPMALHDCYEEHREGVSVTYHDTRDAAYPYSGMRGTDGALLAFEIPHQDVGGRHNYKVDFDQHEVYRPSCPLEPVINKNKKKMITTASM